MLSGNFATFYLQEGALGGDAAGVACERMVGAHHTVARHDNGNGIRTNGICHSTHGSGLADALRSLGIGGGGSVGDLLKLAPHAQLKLRSHLPYWHGKFPQGARKVSIDFGNGECYHI